MIGPNLSEWALKKRSLVIFLMIIGVVAGVMSFTKLGRGEDPAITVRTMVVAAGWPGATVDETIKQVTERLERTLQETDHLDRLRSYTIAGQTTIFVDLKQSTPPDKIPDIWYQVRKNIGDMRHTLPQGVLGPFLNDSFGDTFGIIYAFTADGFNFRELRDYVEAARSRLLQVPDVSKIEVLGAQDEQIFIEFSLERLAGLRLNLNQIVATLQAQNLVRPAGTMQGEQERVFLRVTGAFDSESDIEAVNFVSGDRIFRLGDIATVRRGFTDPPQPMFRVNGKQAIGLAIAMRDAGDILALGENLRREMADIKANLPVGIETTLVADQAVTVDLAISDFMTNLWQAIVIILVCSFVSLGVRPGAVVALAIPLTMAIVFAVMDVANIDLHRISLGALIIALGMLVDDAMTTVDAMLRRLGAGDSADQAATFAYRTLAAPMLIGTLVTIAAFVPIGFAKSGAGEYTFSIFSVVAISLIVSWLVAVVFGPLLGKALLKPPKKQETEPKPGKLVLLYSSFLQAAIRMKWVTIGVTIAAFVAALILLGSVSRQFFPSSDRPELTVDLTLRQNASIFATEAEVKRLETILKADPDVDHFSSYVGRGAIRFILTLNVQLANPFFGQFVVVAKDLEARERLHDKLEKVLAEEFPGVVSRVSPLELGPPVGWPLQYRISGPDKDEVRRLALEFANVVGTDPRARHVHFDWMEPARQLRIKINQDQARQLGVSSTSDRRCAERRHLGHRGDAGPRRHLPGQRRGARHRWRAGVVRVAGVAAGAHAERPHGAAEAVRHHRRGAGVPAGLAPRPGADADGARRRQPRRAARHRGAGAGAEGRRVQRQAAQTLQARDGRPVRGEPDLAGVGVRGDSADDRADAAGDDGHAGQLPPHADGGGDPAAGADRRGDVAAALQPSAGLRRDPGHPGADRHDRQEHVDPDRLDRGGSRQRPRRARRRGDLRHQPVAPDDADRGVHRAGPAADRTDGVLGADGVCHHGRAAGGHGADAGVPARAVHGGARQGGRARRKPMPAEQPA